MNMESKKPWRLNRRTFLRGAGAALALPALECMGRIAPAAEPGTAAGERPGGLQLDTTASARLRGYYTLSSSFDAYVELSFNSDDEPLASVGETKSASLGIRGAL